MQLAWTASNDIENKTDGYQEKFACKSWIHLHFVANWKKNNLIEKRSRNWFSNQTQFRFAFSSPTWYVADVFKPRSRLRQSSLFVVNTRCGLFSCHFCVIFETILTSGNGKKLEGNQLKLFGEEMLCSPLWLRVESGTIGENLRLGVREARKSENMP